MSTEIPTEAEIAELRRQIVRATSWDQLFVSPEQEKADYEKYLVGEAVAEYKKNGSLKNHTVKSDPNGDIHVLEREDLGYSSTYQKLHQGRDVIITFYYPNKQSSSTATCDVGNINHRFSRTNTFIPDYDSLRQIGDEEIQRITGTDIVNLHSYSGGKPATKLWEEMMLNNYDMPQRIGHRIFPHFVLEA